MATRIRPDGPGAETASYGGRPPEFRPLFLGDWMRALFIHYEVDAAVLQNEIPFQLDLWKGRAFVSLVAFTMERLRPRFGGKPGAWLFRPISTARYLNVRTYVRQGNDIGIYFIAEFLSNRFCVPLGRPTFGLPYRFGQLVYRHDEQSGASEGSVAAAGRTSRLTFQASAAPAAEWRASRPGSLDYFLLERYTALTCCGAKRRMFRIRHSPWLQRRMETVVQDSSLLTTTGEWFGRARVAGSNYSPGVRDVSMGRPILITPPAARRRLTVFFDV